ncbi:acetyltransferase (GNAT) family protein [Fontibacillus phaseoli]|uniref:Acetyltransferase (GNAT) family protein n=1 Tax=Fontibacillus phaseoli TaxID=1416533 RepID=A0A369BG82_9BACL|nr:GNAT family N-acetyltransferase [Fontibacillus phaseoli]RCX20569.1 acetyltransferase (GNAT) family protein [Fontibacillus phaseoli]
MDNFKTSPNPVLTEVERITALEMALTQFNAQRALSPKDKKLEMIKIGTTTLLLEAGSPGSSYYNRVIGFGPDELDRLPEILDLYAEHRISPCFDLTPDKQSGELAEALSEQGYVPRLQLAFVTLEVDQAPEMKEESEIRLVPVTGKNVEEYLGLIARSNGEATFDRDLMDRKNGYFYRSDFMNWTAWIGEEPAGMCSLFIRGEEGYAANDYTFPEFRGHGCQSALIRQRIRTAKAMGIKKMYADVEFGSISHNNMLRAGFSTVFVNSFWMKKSKV